jgi:predicted aldo/keto reductase-like oxidoreductase
MSANEITRRRFFQDGAALAGAAALAPFAVAAEPPAKRTAADQVPLGKTGLKLSRLGIGVGSNSGNVQRALGQDAFDRLIRHAYERGVAYIDTADSYRTHEFVRRAIKGLPREKLFIQSKIGGVPEDTLAVLDRFRKELGTDYIDSVLVHCAFTKSWVEERKRLMDGLAEAKEKKIIRAKGVSCHSLPALSRSAQLDWVNVHLVRINPQGAHIDTPVERWDAKSDASHLPAVVAALKVAREKGHGIIGMKIIGDGDFKNPEDREKSIRYAMGSGLVDAVTIGMKSAAEVDEAIERIDRALAGAKG